MEFVQVEMPVPTKSALEIKGVHVRAKSALRIKGLLHAKPLRLRRRLELGGRRRPQEGPHEQTRLLGHAFQGR